MFDVLICIHDQHSPWLVLLAALVCVIATMTSVQLLRHARHLGNFASARWVGSAGVAIGFGIWATHFVAMMGYDPGVIAGFHIPATLASLLIAIAMTTLSFHVALTRPGAKGYALAGLLGGSGIAAMHYIGMSALELPAQITWRGSFVAASLVFAVMPMIPALALAVRGRGIRSGVAAGLLMTLSILLLHFTGMAAVRLVPAVLEARTGVLISPAIMATAIGAGSLGLLALCVAMLGMAGKARSTLHASERDMSILVKGISDCAIYMLDREGKVANWNAGAERLKGYSSQEAIGLPLGTFYTPEDRDERLPERAMSIAAKAGKFSGAGWRMRRDGTCFWAHVTIEHVSDENGDHIGFAKITRDMTRFKQDADKLKEVAGHLDAALDNMHQGLCLFDASQRLVLVNARFREIWGLETDADLIGQTLTDVASAILRSRGSGDLPQAEEEALNALLVAAPADTAASPLELELGETLVVAMVSRGVADGGRVMTFEDITERRRSEAKIAHMAMHDSLTGLPNRPSFAHWVDAELEKARQSGHQLAAVMIDLDRFKDINDTRGHGAGDAALQHLSRQLLDVLAEGELIARLGGDEFAAAKRFSDEADLTEFLARVDSCFGTPLGSAENSFILNASIGVSVFPRDGDRREQILNNADLAMYRAKANPSGRVAFYEPEMDEVARSRRQLASDLRHAIADQALALLYQPQYSLELGQVTGYEALLRWHHPVRGLVGPDHFIPIAEETGEILRIGEWVLREACREACQWLGDYKVAVNLSAVQLLQPDLAEIVHSVLLETGLSPRRLELEITETAIIADKARALHLLRQIKALGVSIAIDDFGTGYSSLDTLHSFPFDKIKIDKSFLLQSAHSVQARAIIKAVLALGQSLSVPVLAEGVETIDQVDLLREQGCEEAQGYYFGAPAAAPRFGADGSRLAS